MKNHNSRKKTCPSFSDHSGARARARCFPLHALGVSFLLSTTFLPTVEAGVRLAPGFSSGMVLQRDVPARLAGWADEGEKIQIKSGGQVVAESIGRGQQTMWSVELPVLKAGPVPDLVIQGNNTITLTDLLAGDVWVCSGQSNMEMTPHAYGGINNAAEEVAKAGNPLLRFYISTNNSGPWTACTPESTAKFSAAGYYFGSFLQKELQVPIGLILAATGGSRAEPWAPPALREALPEKAREGARKTLAELLPVWTVENDAIVKWRQEEKKAKEAGLPPPVQPVRTLTSEQQQAVADARAVENMGSLFTPKIQPVTSQTIKGVLWYQGESNAEAKGDYVWLMGQVISGWRAAWRQDDLPFILMQLVNFHSKTTNKWVQMRADQQTIAETVPHCHIAIGLDLGDAKTIHPPDKKGVGTRLALVALKEVYGRNVTAHGPRVAEVSPEGDAVRIRFDAGGMDEKVVLKTASGTGLELAGRDKKFFPATTRLEEGSLVLEAAPVQAPQWVRYGWCDNPDVTLFNSSGLPAAPFEVAVPFSKK